MTPNVLLMGLRAAGKSTVGAALARATGRPFVELDERTCRGLGHASPAAAIATHGWDAFRQAEARELQAVLLSTGQVVALGGGTPTAPGVEALIRTARGDGRAVLVYLRVCPDVLRERLEGTDLRQRPSITGAPAIDEIEALFAARDGLYSELSTVVIEAGALSVSELVEQLTKTVARP